MIADLVDSATLVFGGAIAWAGALGGATALVLFVLGAWVVKRARRKARRPAWARGIVPAWLLARCRRRRAARSASDMYREAA